MRARTLNQYCISKKLKKHYMTFQTKQGKWFAVISPSGICVVFVKVILVFAKEPCKIEVIIKMINNSKTIIEKNCILMNETFNSQFNQCPIIWMFHIRALNSGKRKTLRMQFTYCIERQKFEFWGAPRKEIFKRLQRRRINYSNGIRTQNQLIRTQTLI